MVLLSLLGLLCAAFVTLVVWPSPIMPLAWEPPSMSPLEGPWAVNEKLREAEIVAAGHVYGPEDVDVDGEGRMYGGTVNGDIVRIGRSGRPEIFAQTGGRPLGLDFAPNGELIVADAIKGLLAIDVQGQVRTLSTEADGVPFGFTDDVVVASDGRIYFSDASWRHGIDDYLLDLLEARPHGRLLRYDPKDGSTETLLDGLYFANGVALSLAEDFVLVNETYRFRITRYWLSGPRAGTSEIFLDGLPGFPDGISSDGAGTFWLAMFTVRNPQSDFLAPRPWLKSLIAKLPRMLWPKSEPYGLIAALNEDGRVMRSLHDPGGGHLYEVTSVDVHGDALYLGSLHNDRIGIVRLETLEP